MALVLLNIAWTHPFCWRAEPMSKTLRLDRGYLFVDAEVLCLQSRWRAASVPMT